MIRLANYAPASVTKARFTGRIKLNTISMSDTDIGLILTLKAGNACVGIYTHKPASGNSYFAIRNGQNEAVDTSKQLEFEKWYEVEGLIENGVQTIKVDGEQIYSGSGNTYYNSSGVIFTKNSNKNGTLDVDIDWAMFQWS